MDKYIKVTVDAIILKAKQKKELKSKGTLKDEIVLIQRKNPPFEGKFALPGGFVEYGETTEEACIREVKEETNLDVEIKGIVGVYSEPNRDPRGHTISIVYLVVPKASSKGKNDLMGKDDAKVAKWFTLSEISEMDLAFDHKKIITDFLKHHLAL